MNTIQLVWMFPLFISQMGSCDMTKKKYRRTKARSKALGKWDKWDNAAFLTFILLLIIFSAYLIYTYLDRPPDQTINQTISQPKAALIDQLGLTFPNQTFIKTATDTLIQAGYSVDYFTGEKVTVDFYRTLPALGYGIIILRVHSALADDNGPPLCLFTSESYSTSRHVYEQLSDQLVSVHYREGSNERLYFGIFPSFVKSSMNGRFNNSMIIMMGCNGLKFTDMAEAFIEKGAKAYMSWNASVSSEHTDEATTLLLKHLVSDNETISNAVSSTTRDVGPDPLYNSQLTFYPQISN
jgi:hypothetical protein